MADSLHPADLAFFARGTRENPLFWSRIGGMPDLVGRSVLDLGCGHGSMAVDLARSGAARVVGLDLSRRFITFARENVRLHHADVADRVEFRLQDLAETPEHDFDYMVSKDTFEHLDDPATLLREMEARLKPGGRIYLGFGPLWNSPYGDHRRTRMILPWGHVLAPRAAVLRWAGFLRSETVRDLSDLGLSGLSLEDYRRVFDACGMHVVLFETNLSERPVSRAFHALARVPALKEYVTHNIYCVLEKRR